MFASAGYTLLFYALALSAVAFAVAVVISRHILRAALCLMAVLIVSAGFYLLLNADFLAGVQVLVYVGGIVVLIVFAVMLTSSTELLEDRPAPLRRLLGFGVAALFFVLTVAAFLAAEFPAAAAAAGTTDNTALIGRMLLDRTGRGYVLPFEIVSLLLLAAAVGGIVVARKTLAGPPAVDQSGRERPC